MHGIDLNTQRISETGRIGRYYIYWGLTGTRALSIPEFPRSNVKRILTLSGRPETYHNQVLLKFIPYKEGGFKQVA